ncbi:MAG: hypothetical protein ACP6IY_06370 [Promethearchaeia archaeon]
MRLILDANALIYLVKTNLIQEFMDLIDDKVVIDNSVYREVIDNGIEKNYQDAHIAKYFLEKYQIPIIPTDIHPEIQKFRDAGETSCFILAKQEGICISCDVRANKKFKKFGIKSIELDTFFYNQLLKKKIDKKKFMNILFKLKNVNGTSVNRILVFLELISEGGENIE